ncbi:MAG: alkaline phosphatase family protein [Armatimonadota bacterium]
MSSRKHPPLVIVGLDGLDPDLVQRWTGEGLLPTLSRLMSEGVFGRLESTLNRATTSAWTCFATGVKPERHGIYYFADRVPGTYTLHLPNSTHRAVPAFWNLLSQAGQRVAICRVPMTYPAEEVNGVMVADWLTPSPRSDGFTWPPDLARELVRAFGSGGWGQLWEAGPTARGAYGRGLRIIQRGVNRSFDLLRWLLRRERWDVLCGVVRETDVVVHEFWHLMDSTHPRHDPAVAERYGDAILRVYQQADARLGELIAALDDDVTVLVLGDHGAGPDYKGPLYVRDVLEMLGLLAWRDSHEPDEPRVRRWKSELRSAGLRFARRVIPWQVRRRLRPLTPEKRREGMTQHLLGSIDWTHTRAFNYSIAAGTHGEVWLNVRGREPAGIVEPGREYEELWRYIADKFTQAREVASGQTAVKEVLRREDVSNGPYSHLVPDLIVRFADGLHISGLRVPLGDGTEGIAGPDSRFADWTQMGAHRLHTAFVACGPNVRRGGAIVEARVWDVAPTVLYLRGATIPAGLDGRVLEGIVTDEFREANPPKYGPEIDELARDRRDYSEEDRLRVEQRLRSLGYL